MCYQKTCVLPNETASCHNFGCQNEKGLVDSFGCSLKGPRQAAPQHLGGGRGAAAGGDHWHRLPWCGHRRRSAGRGGAARHPQAGEQLRRGCRPHGCRWQGRRRRNSSGRQRGSRRRGRPRRGRPWRGTTGQSQRPAGRQRAPALHSRSGRRHRRHCRRQICGGMVFKRTSSTCWAFVMCVALRRQHCI